MTYGEYLGAGSGTTKLLLHLNGNSTDSSGNGNNGTDTSITYVDGKFGKCASFDGSSSYININNPVINSGTAITISCWLKSGSATQAQDVTVFSNQTDAGNYGVFFSRSSSGTANEYSLVYGAGTGAGWQGYGSNKIALSTTSLEHYVFIINGNAIQIYRNGLIIVNSTGTGNVSFTSASSFHLGINPPHMAGRFWNGLNDEYIVENRAWSAQEVAKYYSYAMGRYATL